MVFKSLVSSFRVKFFLNKTLLCSFFCFALFLYVISLQGKLNQTENILTYSTTFSELEKEYRKKFNLLDRVVDADEECSLDYMNNRKLEQDHPCVLKLIRLKFLELPASRDVPYNLSNPLIPGTYEGVGDVDHVLKNKKGGFFVECGAFDGLFFSNSLQFEMNHNWTGLLIEANPTNYQALMKRNRKAWTANVCLSLKPYPTKISFTNPANRSGLAPALLRVVETDETGKKIYDHKYDASNGITKMETIDMQCFPFYSLLLALNQTTVDFFSLDIEGHEKRVLETIPWKKMDVKTIRMETFHIPADQNNKNGSVQLREFLEGEPGYLFYKPQGPFDDLYIRNYL